MKKVIYYFLSLVIVFSLVAVNGCEKESFFTVADENTDVCKVVYADYDDERYDGELYELNLRSITSLLEKITKKEVITVTTDELSSSDGNLILIGNTGLDASNEFLNTLKYSDYGFGISGNSLCIVGHTLDRTNKALTEFEHFLSAINKGDEKYISRGSNGTISFSSKGFTIKKGKYFDLKIDGIPVEEFSIVSNAEDKKYADDLRVFLGEKTGAVLKVYDAESSEQENEILIGDVNREVTNEYFSNEEEAFSEYKVQTKNGKLAFLQKNSATLKDNYDSFIDKLNSSFASNKKLNLTEDIFLSGIIESNIKDRAKGTDVRIACNNIYLWERMGKPIKERCYILYNSFELFDSDVIMLQEVSKYWHETMDTAMQDMGYTLVPTDDSKVANVKAEDNYTPIWYRADKLKLLDYGYNLYSSVKYRPDGDLSTSKSYTWAVFEAEDNKKFACLSTHFTWAPDHFVPTPNELKKSDATEAVLAMKEIETKYPEIPVFLMGDLNSDENSDSYNILAEKYMDARKIAELTHNTNYGSYHNVGEYSAEGSSVIDHTFTNNKNVSMLQYQFAVNEWSINSSDHLPFLLDLALN